MESGRYAVVFAREVTNEDGSERTQYWGCLQSVGKRKRLTDGGQETLDGPRVSNYSFTLKGRHVAFASDELDRSGGQVTRLRVYDLRALEKRYHVNVANPFRRPDGVMPFALTDLILTARGYIAWRETGERTPAEPAQDRVRARDSDGARVLDVAAFGAIDGPDLQRGIVAEWRADGERRQERLD